MNGLVADIKVYVGIPWEKLLNEAKHNVLNTPPGASVAPLFVTEPLLQVRC